MRTPPPRLTCLATAILAAAWVEVGLACTCIDRDPIGTSTCLEFQDATAVFIGEVISVRSLDVTESEALFRVKEWKKGGSAIAAKVRAAPGSMCGVDFQIGVSYFVYAYESDGLLKINGCSGTRLEAEADRDVAFAAAYSAEPATSLEVRLDSPAPFSFSSTRLKVYARHQSGTVVELRNDSRGWAWAYGIPEGAYVVEASHTRRSYSFRPASAVVDGGACTRVRIHGER